MKVSLPLALASVLFSSTLAHSATIEVRTQSSKEFNVARGTNIIETATCRDDEKVVGGGYSLRNPNNRVRLIQSRVQGERAWEVEISNAGRRTFLTVQARCIKEDAGDVDVVTLPSGTVLLSMQSKCPAGTSPVQGISEGQFLRVDTSVDGGPKVDSSSSMHKHQLTKETAEAKPGNTIVRNVPSTGGSEDVAVGMHGHDVEGWTVRDGEHSHPSAGFRLCSVD